MGNYAYETDYATTTINKRNFDKVLAKIKEEAATEQWKGFGWRDSVLKAETFEDVAEKIFGIELVDEGGGDYRPYIDGTYVSSFLKNLIDIVAPYMSNGEILIEDDYGEVNIIFENGKVQIYK